MAGYKPALRVRHLNPELLHLFYSSCQVFFPLLVRFSPIVFLSGWVYFEAESKDAWRGVNPEATKAQIETVTFADQPSPAQYSAYPLARGGRQSRVC